MGALGTRAPTGSDARSPGRSTRVKFLLGFIAILLLVLVAGVMATLNRGCTIELRPDLGVARDLAAQDADRALFWPADESGRTFRWVVESPRDWDARFGEPGSVDVPPLAGSLAVRFAGLGSLTIVLPRDAGADLRMRALDLARSFAQEHPGLCTHVVPTRVAWSDVRSYDGACARLREAEAAVRGSTESFEGLFFGWTMWAAMLGNFGGILVPCGGRPGTFLLATDLGHEIRGPVLFREAPAGSVPVEELDAEAVLDRIAAPRGPRPATPASILIIIPADATPEDRAAGDSIAARLAGPDRPDAVVLRRTTRIPAASFTSADGLREQLPALAQEIESSVVPDQTSPEGR